MFSQYTSTKVFSLPIQNSGNIRNKALYQNLDVKSELNCVLLGRRGKFENRGSDLSHHGTSERLTLYPSFHFNEEEAYSELLCFSRTKGTFTVFRNFFSEFFMKTPWAYFENCAFCALHIAPPSDVLVLFLQKMFDKNQSFHFPAFLRLCWCDIGIEYIGLHSMHLKAFRREYKK